MSKLTIDDCTFTHSCKTHLTHTNPIPPAAGDAANSKSDGKAAGHNTDGFDVSTTDLTIEDRYLKHGHSFSCKIYSILCVSTIHNQDDCLAINKGSNIVFQRNTCIGGHGISVGSISSDATVSDITISGNTITNK